MKTFALSVLFATSIAATAAFAAAPTEAPSGTMGMCKDGTYSSSAEKKGACRGHKGVKDWYGEEAAPVKTTGATTTTTPSMTASTAPAQGMGMKTGKTSTSSLGNSSSSMTTAAAPGGGAGQVWSNDNTKVYHCSGDKWYGKTKHGEYMSEGDAKAKGLHADHGKACS